MQTDLLSKLQKAGEGSRALDFAFFREIGAPLPDSFGPLKLALTWQEDGTATMPVGQMQVRYTPAPYTTSLDALRAVASRHGFHLNSEPRFHIDGERVDYVSHALRPRWDDWRPDDEWFDRGEGRHADQVLSAAIALLTALQHQGAEHG